MSYRRSLTGEGLIMLVASNVRRLRAEAGISARVAAERGGIGLRIWQKIEAGESNLKASTLAAVCLGLDVDVLELLREPSKKS